MCGSLVDVTKQSEFEGFWPQSRVNEIARGMLNESRVSDDDKSEAMARRSMIGEAIIDGDMPKRFAMPKRGTAGTEANRSGRPEL